MAGLQQGLSARKVLATGPPGKSWCFSTFKVHLSQLGSLLKRRLSSSCLGWGLGGSVNGQLVWFNSLFLQGARD